jgi:hypothetical protein
MPISLFLFDAFKTVAPWFDSTIAVELRDIDNCFVSPAGGSYIWMSHTGYYAERGSEVDIAALCKAKNHPDGPRTMT